jgi:hypothetical protein
MDQENCSKKFVFVSLAVFLIIAAIVGLVWAWSVYKKANYPTGASTITVSAEGKITVKPDLAVVNFSVVTQGLDPNDVQKTNDEKMAKAINYLKTAAIDEKDIKTTSYNLAPQYDYNWCNTGDSHIYCPPKLVSYTLTQQVQVKLRDLAKVGEVIGNLPEQGVNEISSINFTVDNDEAPKIEARQQAIEKAMAQATLMAKASGIKIGRIINIAENGAYMPYPYAEKAAVGLGGGTVSASSPIQSGSQDITVDVSITYEIQ